MKADVKAKYEYSAEIIDFKLKKTEMKQDNDLENDSRKRACFRTDRRYMCQESNCASASECKKLVAIWMR